MSGRRRIKAAGNAAQSAANAVESFALDEAAPPHLSFLIPSASEFVLQESPPNDTVVDHMRPRESTVMFRPSADGLSVERELASNRDVALSLQIPDLWMDTCKDFPDGPFSYRVIGRYRFSTASGTNREVSVPDSVTYYNPTTGAVEGTPTIPNPLKVWAIPTGMLVNATAASVWDHHRALPVIGPTGEITSVKFSGSSTVSVVAEFTLVDMSNYEMRYARLTGVQIKAAQAAASATPWTAGETIAAGDLRYTTNPRDTSINTPASTTGSYEGRLDYVFCRKAGTPTTTAATFVEEFPVDEGETELWKLIGFRDASMVVDLVENPDGTGASSPMTDISNVLFTSQITNGEGANATIDRRYRNRQAFQAVPLTDDPGKIGLTTVHGNLASYQVHDDAEILITAIGSTRSDYSVSLQREALGARRKEADPLASEWHGGGGGELYGFPLGEGDEFEAAAEYAPYIQVLADQNTSSGVWQNNVTHLDSNSISAVFGSNDKASLATSQWLQMQVVDLAAMAEADEGTYDPVEIDSFLAGWKFEFTPTSPTEIVATKLVNVTTGDELPVDSIVGGVHTVLFDRAMFSPTGLLNNTRPGRVYNWRLENATEQSAIIAFQMAHPALYRFVEDDQANLRLEYETPASNDPADFDSLLIHLNIRDGLNALRNDYMLVEGGNVLATGAPADLADGNTRTVQVFHSGVWSNTISNDYAAGSGAGDLLGEVVLRPDQTDLAENPYSNPNTKQEPPGSLQSDANGCISPITDGAPLRELFQNTDGSERLFYAPHVIQTVRVFNPSANENAGPYIRNPVTGHGMWAPLGGGGTITLERIAPDNQRNGVLGVPLGAGVIPAGAGEFVDVTLEFREKAAFGGADGWRISIDGVRVLPAAGTGEAWWRDTSGQDPEIVSPFEVGRIFLREDTLNACGQQMAASGLGAAPGETIVSVDGGNPGVVRLGQPAVITWTGDRHSASYTVYDSMDNPIGSFAATQSGTNEDTITSLDIAEARYGPVRIVADDTGNEISANYPPPAGKKAVNFGGAVSTPATTAQWQPNDQVEYDAVTDKGDDVEVLESGHSRITGSGPYPQIFAARRHDGTSWQPLDDVYSFQTIAKIGNAPNQTHTAGTARSIDFSSYFNSTKDLPPEEIGRSGSGLTIELLNGGADLSISGLVVSMPAGAGAQTRTPRVRITDPAGDSAEQSITWTVTATAGAAKDVIGGSINMQFFPVQGEPQFRNVE